MPGIILRLTPLLSTGSVQIITLEVKMTEAIDFAYEYLKKKYER